MKFLVLMIPEVYQPGKKVDPNFIPPMDKMKRMMAFNDELATAGALLSLNGLQPLANGARVTITNNKPTVTDGPFIEAKEVVGGYWMLEAKSKQEVIEWMKKCPAEPGDTIEIRPLFEMADFPMEVNK